MGDDNNKKLRFCDAFRRYVLDEPELNDLAMKACEIDAGSRLVFENLHYPSETYLANNGYCWPISYNWEYHCKERDGSDLVVLPNTITDGLDGPRREVQTPDEVLRAFERLGELVPVFFEKLASEELIVYGRHPTERTSEPIPWDYWEPDDSNKCVDIKHGKFCCYLERFDSNGSRRLIRFEGMKVGIGDTMPSPESSDGHDLRGNVSISAAEKRCEKWLQALPNDPRKKKNDAFIEAKNLFSGLSERAFVRAWAKEAPASWKLRGRPGKTKHRTN